MGNSIRFACRELCLLCLLISLGCHGEILDERDIEQLSNATELQFSKILLNQERQIELLESMKDSKPSDENLKTILQLRSELDASRKETVMIRKKYEAKLTAMQTTMTAAKIEYDANLNTCKDLALKLKKVIDWKKREKSSDQDAVNDA